MRRSFSFALLLLLVCLLSPASAQVPLDPSWLGTPEAADYQHPAVYWQRVLAVNSGRMSPAQRAQVEHYIAVNQSLCTPYAASPCWEAPAPPKVTPKMPVFRPGQRYQGPYGWQMRVLSVTLDGRDEIITGRWLDSAPSNGAPGEVFAFINSPSQTWMAF